MRIELALSTVKTRVVISTLIITWLLSFTTTPETTWLDWMACILLFWTIYQPSRINLVWAFSLGLLMDIQHDAIFGEHALIYVWLVYFGGYLAQRLQYSSLFIHAVTSMALIFGIQLLRALAHLLLLNESANLLPMLWMLMMVPAWLLLSWLLSRSQVAVVGSWLMD